MDVINALIEGVTQDLIVFLVEDRNVVIEDAMKLIYNTITFEKLSNSDTGLYRESSSYVYELLRDELRDGKLIQNEF